MIVVGVFYFGYSPKTSPAEADGDAMLLEHSYSEVESSASLRMRFEGVFLQKPSGPGVMFWSDGSRVSCKRGDKRAVLIHHRITPLEFEH
jgi:hypothetical protein